MFATRVFWRKTSKMLLSTGPAARTRNSRIARQPVVAARMAPQDASPMRLYSAMADVTPFLFIVFQRGELLAVFQFHGARVLGKRSSPAAFRVLFPSAARIYRNQRRLALQDRW